MQPMRKKKPTAAKKAPAAQHVVPSDAQRYDAWDEEGFAAKVRTLRLYKLLVGRRTDRAIHEKEETHTVREGAQTIVESGA